MLASASENTFRYPSSYSNWAGLMMNYAWPFSEIVITGNQSDEKRKNIASRYFPNAILAGSSKAGSDLPLLKDRYQNGKTFFYICTNKTCSLPTEDESKAISILEKDSRNLKNTVNY